MSIESYESECVLFFNFWGEHTLNFVWGTIFVCIHSCFLNFNFLIGDMIEHSGMQIEASEFNHFLILIMSYDLMRTFNNRQLE